MTVKIKNIYENDFGCEERSDSDVLSYICVLVSPDGEKTEMLISDEFLRSNNLDEGSEFDLSLLSLSIFFGSFI